MTDQLHIDAAVLCARCAAFEEALHRIAEYKPDATGDEAERELAICKSVARRVLEEQ